VSAQMPTVLLVPGLRGDMPDHWQTLLQAELPKVACVPRLGHELSREAWVEALDASIRAIDGAIMLVAHSAGAIIVAHWAKTHRRKIRGALLATPPDLEAPLPDGYPSMQALEENGWFPVPTAPLPFPSIVAASSNDPLARIGRVLSLAVCWGSRFVDLGDVGHLNPASGYGPWPRAHDFIRELLDPVPLPISKQREDL
jgi:predicted alpha/beta hydrolase family esterase